jgi:hypothetical protein
MRKHTQSNAKWDLIQLYYRVIIQPLWAQISGAARRSSPRILTMKTKCGQNPSSLHYVSSFPIYSSPWAAPCLSLRRLHCSVQSFLVLSNGMNLLPFLRRFIAWGYNTDDADGI